MENRMSEDVERIEKEIEIELSRISVSAFEADDPDTDVSEEALSDSDTISDDLPESVLSYLNFIKSRNQDAEKLILQDLEDEEITSNVYEVVSSHASDYLAELALEYNEDPEEFKKRVLSEIESEDLQIATNCNTQSTIDDPIEVVTDEHFVAGDVGMSINFTYHEVEEKCRQDFVQWEKRQKELEVEKRKKWKAERAAQEKENEEEQERRLQRLEEFEAERIKLELLHKKHQSMMEDKLQQEKKVWREKMMQHEELMMKLQLQVEEEEQAFEEQKAKQRQRMAEQENVAAVKIQARFRSYLVYKKYAPILKERKDKIKQEKEMQKEVQRKMKEKEERMKSHMEEMKQKKEEKKRQEERERQRYLEQERRCEEYEKKKVSLRLEKQLQIRKEKQRNIREKGDIMNENRVKYEENLTEEKLGENLKAVREQKMESSKQVVEEEKNQTVKMDETSNWMIPVKRKLTPPIPKTLNSEKEPSSEVNKNLYRSSGMCAESSSDSRNLNTATVIGTSKKESVAFRDSERAENKANKTNIKAVREQKMELSKQVMEEEKNKSVMMDETSNWMIPLKRKLTPPIPNILSSEKKEPSSEVNNAVRNSEMCVERSSSDIKSLNTAPVTDTSEKESVDFRASDMSENKSNEANINAVREKQPEPSKQMVEEGKNQTVKMDETSNWMIPVKRKLTPPIPNILNSEKKEPSSEVNNPVRNSEMCAERSSSDAGNLNTAPVTGTSKKESVDFRASDMSENKSNEAIIKTVREKQLELSKQMVEEEKNQTVRMDETSNCMTSVNRRLPLSITNIINSAKEPSSEVNNKCLYRNSEMCAERSSSDSRNRNAALVIGTSKKESIDFRTEIMVENKEENTNSRPLNAQTNAINRETKDQFFQPEIVETAVFLVKDSNKKLIENWDRIQDVAKYSNSLEILPDDIEKKRLNWMKTCKPWCKIFGENHRKTITKKKHPRKISIKKMPPLSTDKIINSGPWSTLQQVTILALEDLPECSLSTLSECANLQVLVARRCGLVALEGLSNCKDLKYINVEENNIQIIDCENLEKLCILILSKNHLSSVCGLDGCTNLRSLELSYNKITRISGLESLKNLQQLIVDHNQLISTKGLCEAPTLMHLDCSFNHLTQVEGIENSGLLQILKLQGNNLQELPRLENHVLLRELYLDDNSISSMRTFSLFWLPLLQILSLSQNSLTELAPLNSCVSLEKLDIRNNRLSDLKSVIVWLNGCHKLTELSISGNPLLQETMWRSSLCKVLNSLQFLNGENINYHTLFKTERIEESESRTFLELCQSQIEENVLLKKKAANLGIASSIDDAQRQCWYFNQLMKLSIKHRRAHECGELSITDRDGPEALQNHLKQTSTGCLQENNLFIMGATENKQILLDSSERWIATDRIQATFINSSIPEHQKENKEHHRTKQESTESCISYDGESKDTANKSAQFSLQQSVATSNMERNLQHFDTNTKKLHMAASVIQSIWRKHHSKKKTGSTKTENDQFTDASRKKHEAATLIQAFWKGFLLRKKLASALAAVKSDEVEDDYEEITMDDYTFHEAALEKEWLVLDTSRFPSKTLTLSNQLHWPKKYSMPSESCEHPVSLPWAPVEAWQCDDRPHSHSPETLHFHNMSEKGTMSQLSDMKEEKKFLFRSRKEEKISEEWGFKDISTAQLMLKRAQKMKPQKINNKKLDPAVRLALFKNNENKHLLVKPPRKTQPVNIGYFEGEREKFSRLDTALDEKVLRRKDFTYQWLHTQVWDYEAASSRNMKCNRFLPELDPAICNGRRVQLVASPVSREDTDLDLVSMTSGSALTQNRGKNNQAHRHSARLSKKNISTPERLHLGPSRKERISFRDHPVQLSGGWGSGKKRQKLKNIS
ncbi:leucine-rich repeat- and IQ domain-containing protein 1 [Eudromia elegans]